MTSTMLAHVEGLYAAIENGATGADLAAFFHPEAEQIEFPSLVSPHGNRRPLAGMLAGAERGKQMIRDQRYRPGNAVEQGDRLAVQLTWTATTAADGTELTAYVAAFYEFRDGLILRQSSYDCYEPFVK